MYSPMLWMLYIVPFSLAVVMLSGVAVYGWRFRREPMALPVLGALLLCAAWSLSDVCNLLSVTLDSKIFWIKARYTVVALLPLACLLAAAHYIRQTSFFQASFVSSGVPSRLRWMTEYYQAVLAVIPLIILVLLWSDGLGGRLPAVLYGFGMESDASRVGFVTLLQTHFLVGPWYWVLTAYSYILLFLALALMMRSLGGASALYIRQTLLVIAGALPPMVIDAFVTLQLVFGLDNPPLRDDDLTPFGFLISGLIFAYGLYYYHVLDIVPVARGVLIESMSDGMLVIDVHERILDINQAALDLLAGAAPASVPLAQALVGQPLDRALVAWQGETWLHPLLDALESHPAAKPVSVELVSPDGLCLDVRLSLLSADGVSGRLILLCDISERKQAEEELWHLKEFSEDIVQQMAEGIAIQDGNGVYRFVNPAGAAMLGYSPDELVGKPKQFVVPPDQLPILESAQERRIRGEADRYEMDLLRKDGARISVQVSGMPQINQHTGQLSSTLAVFTDITERKSAEQALRERDAQYSKLVDQLAMLYRIGLAITSSISIDGKTKLNQVLETVYQQCKQIGPIDSFYVALYDEPTGEIQFLMCYDQGVYSTYPARSIHQQPGLTGYVILSREPLYIPDVHQFQTTLGQQEGSFIPVYLQDTAPCAYIGVPLILRERVIGVISMQNYQPDAYTLEQVHLLEMVAIQAAIAIENSRLYEQVQHEIAQRREAEISLRRANDLLQRRLVSVNALQEKLYEESIRDPLTGLFNRRYMHETLARELSNASRDGRSVGLVMVDIDHFKDLNDTYLHQAGDRVLKELAKLLQQHTRKGDIACRYGGEEFLVVMPGASIQNAYQRAERWRQAFETLSISHGSKALRATISLGVAVFPLHGCKDDDLVRAADQAMYIAKNSGRNRTVVYTDGSTDQPKSSG